jgi:DNA-binding transcriptional LysR family regulator
VNLKHLHAFVEVAEQGHFGRAASQLGMTQSGLSQLVKSLEKKIGAQLIYRTTRSVSLTDAGEVFLENARRLVDAHHLADQRMAHFLHGEEGNVRLGFVASAALGIVPRMAQLLHDKAPRIRLSLGEMTSDEQIPRLKAGDIDVGVMREIREYSGLLITPLHTEPLRLAVPKNHDIANRESVSLSEVNGEGFIMFPRTKVSYLHDHIHRLCHDAGFTPHIVEQAVQFATILGLVSSNAGIAIVPDSIRAIHLPNVTFIPIADPHAVSQVYIARRRDERASPAAKRLVEIATSASRDNSGWLHVPQSS